MDKPDLKGILFAVLAATLYALSTPISKLLLDGIQPIMTAAFLYLGAGAGTVAIILIKNAVKRQPFKTSLIKADARYVFGMVTLDIAAPILLMFGLRLTTAANAALLNNFEIAATALMALLIFKETISKRLWIAIALVSAACVMLSLEGTKSFSFSAGSLLVLGACVCWGFENNCTRMLSHADPFEIVAIKGVCSGAGALIIALVTGESMPEPGYTACTLALGFVAYGLSISAYIYAQRTLGAAKTSTFYAVAPFIGTALSMIIFKEQPGAVFFAALAVMAVGTYLASTKGRKARSVQ